MTDCPVPELLAALLDDDLNAQASETLVAHVEQCPSCRDVLLRHAAVKLRGERLQWLLRERRVGGLPRLLPERHLRGSGSGPDTLPVGTEHQAPSPQQDNRLPDRTLPLDGVPAVAPRAAHGPRVETAPDQVGQRFGDYELRDQLGAGGMGIVYRAWQTSAHRQVALKLIRPELLESLSPDQRQGWICRFRTEAQTAARLEHDHVVTIFDVGEYQGTLYYSMQYVDGPSLAQVVRDGPLENRRAAGLIRGVARAVAYAHQQGVLHRDLKPQNILIRPEQSETVGGGERPAEATAGTSAAGTPGERPLVVDFGVAKLLDEGAASATHTGEVVGSPSYMSPEQARDASRCTPASDIYSLGATLYELLTGRPPFCAATALATLWQVVDQEPVACRDLNPAIDRDLETITLKALAKEPARRYPTAAAMADDLHRYLMGEPIQARPVGVVERTVRWCRRNPVIAGLTAGLAALLLIAACGSIGYSVRLRQQRAEAESYFRTALDVIDEMLTDFSDRSLAHLPHMEQVREDLLRKALRQHEELLATRPSNRRLRIDFARTQRRLGDLYDLLGRHGQASAAYQEAIRQCRTLRRQSPGDRQVQHLLAVSHSMLAELLRQTEPAAARQHYETALAIQRELHALFPGKTEYQTELSRTLNNLGLLLSESGEHGEAREALEQAIELLQELAGTAQASPEILSDLGRSHINLGVVLRQLPASADRAESAYRDAIGVMQEARRLDPQDPHLVMRQAVARMDLGNLLLTEIDDGVGRAVQLLTNAKDQLQGLCDGFPAVPLYWYELANSHSNLAVALATQHDRSQAASQFQRALDVLDQIARDFPSYPARVAKYHSLQGRALGGQGYLQYARAELTTARVTIEQAIVAQTEAVRLSPHNPEYLLFLSQHHQFLAQILDQLDRDGEADESRQTAQSFAQRSQSLQSPGDGQRPGAVEQ